MTDTLSSRFRAVVAENRDTTAFLVKRDCEWRSFTFGWAMEQVRKTAFGLQALGIERGDRLAILSENRPEWATTDFATMAAGGLIVPLYTTLIPKQVEYILNDAEARVVFVSNMAHLKTIQAVRGRIPSLEKVVVFYPENLQEDDVVISLDTLKAMGDGHSMEDFERLSAEARPEDPCTFVYTSGTTGDPKGVVLSHGNFIAEYDAVEPCILGGEGDVTISFLPLSHILQRVVDTFSLLTGFSLAYAESLETLGENLREVRPTHVVAVPRVWEKIYSRIHDGAKKGSAAKQALFKWSLDVGHRYRLAEAKGRISPLLALQHRLADVLVFSKIRAATGGRVKLYISTGAPLARHLAVFYDDIGIRILEVWGMTELTGAATVNTYRDYRFGSVGKPCPGVELKIEQDGEICVRSDIAMQKYWRKPEATSETIDSDGWLHTGDVGHLDDDGFLHITDRIKELIVTAGGKNVAPQPLENALKGDALIAQAMVVGDKRNFVSALIVPDREAVEAWAGRQGIEGDFEALCADDRLRAEIEGRVSGLMENFSRYERVKQFELISEEFTPEAGELTPTLKLKRRVILAKYEALINGMYREA